MGWKEFLINILEEYRGIVILIFVLPAGFIFDLAYRTRRWIYTKLFSSPKSHDDRVKKIQSKVERWNKSSNTNKKLLCTSRPNWLSLSTTFFRKDLCHKVDIDLYNILSFNEKKLTIRVEPMVTVGEITNYLVPRGYTLAVTLEIADATLGGLAMGTGMTTHSHKVGLFQENITSYEVVLGDGSLIEATNDNEYKDLYSCLPWSHGSLAFLVALTLKVVPVKPYIRMKYIPVTGQKKYCDEIRKYSGANGENVDSLSNYVEMTIYEKNKAVIMLGDYSDYDPALPVNNISSWYKPWFYKYVETFLTKGKHEELIPMREYLLRHNRAIFWVVESMIPFGNNPLFRLLFGWLLPPKPAFLKFTTTPGIREFTFTKQVFQDIVLPINQLENQINTSEQLFEAYPLLVYPCRVYNNRQGQIKQPDKKYTVPGTTFAMYNDLGIYGVPGQVKNKKPYNPVKAMREMEKFTRDIGGFSFLYADIFMTKQEFEEMFDLKLYEIVRRKYKAIGAFPHLYDKVKPEIDILKFSQEYNSKKIK